MKSPIRIGARKSDLARLQAVTVADLLKKKWPALQVEFFFSESLGDKNQTNPLWKMPEKGVFTSDLSEGLKEGRYDLVVHSWKDLPLESDSTVLGCPPREDARDVVLFRKNDLQQWQRGGSLVVLSSSPRRERNLESFLKTYLPHPPKDVRFVPVRGNIPTRLQKLLKAESGAQALVIARAALLRLLSAESSEFQSVRHEIDTNLQECLQMVVPLSINPAAPAQGALALETRAHDPQMESLLAPILCATSTEQVRSERTELAKHGGGCHQKIGVSVESTPWGSLKTVRGLTSSGQVLDERAWLRDRPQAKDSQPFIPWSTRLAGVTLFGREPIASATARISQAPEGPWYVSHPDAWPLDLQPDRSDLRSPRIWCSGLMTWRKLAQRGFWVEGCDDSLGESLPPGFTKLGHVDSPELGAGLATYRLIPLPVSNPRKDWKIDGKTHFFWKSISQFERVSQSCPEILEMHHACGPGSTARALRDRVRSLEVCLDEADWWRHHGIKSPI